MDVEIEPLSPSILQQWAAAKYNLTHWKEEERRLRHLAISENFPNAKVGVNSLQLDDNWCLKAQIKESLELDKDHTKVSATCGQLEAAGMPTETIKKLIKWEPTISQGEYNKLANSWRAIVDVIVTIKPSSSTLAIVPIKRD